MAQDKQKKAGLAQAPTPTTTTPDEQTSSDGSLLKLLENALQAPVLSLVHVYLNHSNGNKRTTENTMLDFRETHPWSWKAFFILDFCFRLVYMVAVFLVVIRGLGIGEYVKTLFN